MLNVKTILTHFCRTESVRAVEFALREWIKRKGMSVSSIPFRRILDCHERLVVSKWVEIFLRAHHLFHLNWFKELCP